jgi:hypothetical protein
VQLATDQPLGMVLDWRWRLEGRVELGPRWEKAGTPKQASREKVVSPAVDWPLNTVLCPMFHPSCSFSASSACLPNALVRLEQRRGGDVSLEEVVR